MSPFYIHIHVHISTTKRHFKQGEYNVCRQHKKAHPFVHAPQTMWNVGGHLYTEMQLASRMHERRHAYTTLTVVSGKPKRRPASSHCHGSSTFSTMTVASGGTA